MKILPPCGSIVLACFVFNTIVLGQDGSSSNHDRQIIVSIEDAQLELVHNVRVASRDAGKVVELPVQPNDRVNRQQTIIRLDRDFYQAELAAAEVELAIAKKEGENEVDLQYAEKSAQVNLKVLDRSRQAYEAFNRSVSRTELERLELELERANLSGQQARHKMAINQLGRLLKKEQVKAAALRLQHRDITSPLDGEVARVLVQKGEWVQAGQTVARIINIDKLRIVALVPEQYVLDISPNQPAEFVTQLGDKGLAATGRIAFVSPEINPVNGEFLIWVEIQNSNRIFRPGLRGRLTIFSNE